MRAQPSHEELGAKVRESFLASDPTYGAGPVTYLPARPYVCVGVIGSFDVQDAAFLSGKRPLC